MSKKNGSQFRRGFVVRNSGSALVGGHRSGGGGGGSAAPSLASSGSLGSGGMGVAHGGAAKAGGGKASAQPLTPQVGPLWVHIINPSSARSCMSHRLASSSG